MSMPLFPVPFIENPLMTLPLVGQLQRSCFCVVGTVGAFLGLATVARLTIWVVVGLLAVDRCGRFARGITAGGLTRSFWPG